jgi:hypothetical protein
VSGWTIARVGVRERDISKRGRFLTDRDGVFLEGVKLLQSEAFDSDYVPRGLLFLVFSNILDESTKSRQAGRLACSEASA